MGLFIFCIFILYVVYLYPQVILVTGLLLAGFWLYGKYDLIERGEESDEDDDIVDDMAGWSAKKSALEDLDKKLNHDVMKSEDFKAEGRRIAAILEKRGVKADLEMEQEKDKPIIRKTTPKKPPIVPHTDPQTITDEEIFATMDELNSGPGSISDDFNN